jgi:hypothetical protein
MRCNECKGMIPEKIYGMTEKPELYVKKVLIYSLLASVLICSNGPYAR